MEQEPEPPLGGRMFKKILIANRGEIACRVIRTARSMGIATVAVYSDADKDALHVEMADEAVRIGPPPAADSYLVIEAIIEACRSTGAEAVHPGYGFLSENAAFATALADAGITFIGPNVKAIEVMGDKIASKAFAKDAQVNTVPGHPDVIGSDDEAVRVATEIGFPVMLKASAGGGGKGMRIAHSADEVAEGFVSSMNEARSSFGDDRVFIEKFIVEPRHIEIQVMGDRHGNVIHLGERECSIQRRNQKVIEEAPSPFLDEATRAEMGAQAVALAKAVSYESAGTVEFIVDQDRNFYFLEMNTRLQVEHPVTELVTGFDLVELMIRVAAGEPLPIAQDDVTLNGWAVEARIYAEDPYRNFLPSIGRLVRYDPPDEGVADGLTVRNDTGVYEGGAISMFYDPMIAKLCTHAPSRAEATRHMADALDRFTIIGIEHNTPFLTALMNHPRWHEGRLTTGFIAEEYPDGFTGLDADQQTIETICIAAAVMDHISNERRRYISGQMHGPSQFPRERKVAIGQNLVPVSVLGVDSDFDVTVSRLDGELRVAAVSTSWRPGMDCFEAMIDDHVIAVQVRPILNGHRMIHRGVDVVAKVYTAREADLLAKMPVKEAPDTSNQLLCPMPGLVVSISVEVGQKIKAGETLCVVEAMKMENVLRADRDVTVEKINAKPGESLAVDAVIMEFER